MNPLAVELLRTLKLPTEGLRSKSWDEFAAAGAPVMDIVVTVCDQAASEVCPVWPGGPMAAHWGLADPAAVKGSGAEMAAAFRLALGILESRIKVLVRLPVSELDRRALQAELNSIARLPG